MTAPNRDLDQAGWMLQQVVAAQLTAALEHIHRELSTLDGYPAGQSEVNVRAKSELTTVESTTAARMDLWSASEGLKLAKNRVLVEIRDLNELCNQALRMRQPRTVVRPEDKKKDLCCSGQTGKHAAVEWGDPLCMMPAVKAGLCQAHYQSWYRARKRDGIDTSKDYEPA